MKTPILRLFLILLLSQNLLASDSNWSVQCNDASRLQIHYQNIPVVEQINFRAITSNRKLAYQIQSTVSQNQNNKIENFISQLTGPEALQSQISWQVKTLSKGVILKLHLKCQSDLKYQRWLTGVFMQYAQPVVKAHANGIVHWVDQDQSKRQLWGDMPYQDVAAQVRTVTFKNKQIFKLASNWFDAGWDKWDDKTKTKRAKNFPFSPGIGPVDKTITLGIFDADLPNWLIASTLQQDKIAAQIQTPHTANLYEPNEPIALTMELANVTSSRQTAQVDYDIYDYHGKRLETYQHSHKLDPFAITTLPITLPGQPQGMLYIAGRIHAGSWSRPIWTTIGILPKRPAYQPDQSSPFGLAHLFKGQADLETIIALGQRIGTRWWRRFQALQNPFTTQAQQKLRDHLDLFKNNGICVQLQYQGPKNNPAKNYTDCYAKAAFIAKDYGNFFCPGNEMNPRPVGKRKVSTQQQQDTGKDHAKNLQKPFHTAIKNVSKNCFTTTQAMGGIPTQYVQGFGQAGGFNWIDALNFHPYFYPHSPEYSGKGYYVLARHLRTAANACKQFGSREWIISETGYPTVINPNRGVSMRTQAEYMVRSHVLMLGAGCRLIEWYTLQDGRAIEACPDPKVEQSNFGMLYTDLAPKPSYLAYGVMTDQLDGLKVTGRYNLGDHELYAIGFGKTDQPELFVLWSYKEKDERDRGQPRKALMPWIDRYQNPVTVKLKTKGIASITDIMGRTSLQKNTIAQIKLTGSPLYIRNIDLRKLIPLDLIK